jgi:bacillopeptidase F
LANKPWPVAIAGLTTKSRVSMRIYLQLYSPGRILRGFLVLSLALLGVGFNPQEAVSAVVSPQVYSALGRSAEASVPVIVTLNESVDLESYMAAAPQVRALGKAGRREHRAGLIRTLRSRAESSQHGLRERLHRRGMQRITDLWLINGLAFDATSELIAELAALPEVASIKLDGVVQLPEVTPLADNNLNAIEDNIDLIHAPELWALGYTGQNVAVAILDSGVDVQHPYLSSRWRGGNNSWFNAVAATCSTFACTACDANTTTPCDYLDRSSDPQGIAHGTGVAGVVVGGNAGGQSIGVAPGARWIAAKIFRSDDQALFSGIHAALQWLLDPDGIPATDDAPDIVNGSWGFDPGSCIEEFRPDIQLLKAAGIAVVLSGGNGGPAANTSVSPANYPESFAVGSVGNSHFVQSTEISDFSGRGPSLCDNAIYPEVVAPGFVRTADLSFGGLATYINIAGTSFSTPHAAGVMALLLSADPSLTVTQLEQTLLNSATDLGPTGPDNDFGFGLVNALTAFDLLNLTPQLGVIDPVPPVDDQIIDFGNNIQVGTSVNQVLTLKNIGGGALIIAGLDTAGLTATPFTVVSDQCTGITLGTGMECSIQVGFSPTAAGSFSGSFLVNSNDAAQPAAQVALLGQGVVQAPVPQLLISNSNLSFDQILPGATSVTNLTLSNAPAAGPLQIQGFESSNLPTVFSLAADTCTGTTLLGGLSCTLQVRFAPLQAGLVAGSFQVLSNGPASPHQIQVQGLSNTPPPAAQLQSPANASSGLATSLTLSWIQQPDVDGDTVTNTVQLATTSNLLNPIEIPVVGVFEVKSGLLLGSFGFAVLLSPLGLLRRRKLCVTLLTLGIAVGLLVLASCGGGGGGNGTDTSLRSQPVSGLSAGTTYFWRVLSDDGQGGASQSEVFSFTTQ